MNYKIRKFLYFSIFRKMPYPVTLIDMNDEHCDRVKVYSQTSN